MEIDRITEEHCQILVKTYESIKAHLKYNGMQVFIRLFSEYPAYKDIWPQFRAIPDSSLMHSDALRTHAFIYLNGMSKIVYAAATDKMLLLQTIRKMARSHARRNVHKSHVMHMLSPFLDMIRSNNIEITEEIRDAWATLFDVIGNLVESSNRDEMTNGSQDD